MYFTCILFCLFMDVYYMYFFICYVQCFGNMSKYVMPIKQYELRERERERERGGVTLDKKIKIILVAPFIFLQRDYTNN